MIFALAGTLVTVLAMATAMSAGAAAPRSANRFVEAVERGQRTLAGAGPEIDRRTREIERELSRCESATEGDFSDRVNARIELQGGAVVWSALLHPYVELSLPALRQVVADLDAVATRDPALHAGRQAWHRGVRLFTSLAPPPQRPCEALERWRDSGFAAAQAPISRRDALRFWDTLERTDDERDSRYARAVKRLRELGIPGRRAKAFNGHRVFDIFFDDH